MCFCFSVRRSLENHVEYDLTINLEWFDLSLHTVLKLQSILLLSRLLTTEKSFSEGLYPMILLIYLSLYKGYT